MPVDQASIEFRLRVQPERGMKELVTHNSHRPLMFTVAFANEAYPWNPIW